MVDATNLLNVVFALITNFANVVAVAPLPVPRTTDDLHNYVMGSPYSPTEVYIRSRAGLQFRVRDGAVELFETPGSYFHLQDPEQVTNFLGTPQMTSNQVVELANDTLRRLVKDETNPSLTHPRLISAGRYRGQMIPYYQLTWPAVDKDPASPDQVYGYSARMEIDARTGRIQFLELPARRFHDYVLAQQIIDKVYKPEVRPGSLKARARKLWLLRATTNEVSRAIATWLQVCNRVGMNPGTQTSVTDVNWEETGVLERMTEYPTGRVCRVTFNNSAVFDAVNGYITDSTTADKFFDDDFQKKDLRRFFGPVRRRWQDLVQELDQALEANFGFPKKLVASYVASPEFKPPELGTESLTRCLVAWRKYPNRHLRDGEIIPISESQVGLLVEFDLSTGQVKAFGFKNDEFGQPFTRAQSEWPK